MNFHILVGLDRRQAVRNVVAVVVVVVPVARNFELCTQEMCAALREIIRPRMDPKYSCKRPKNSIANEVLHILPTIVIIESVLPHTFLQRT